MPDRLERVDQHDDVQGQIITNVKPDQNLESKRQCIRQRHRKLTRDRE